MSISLRTCSALVLATLAPGCAAMRMLRAVAPDQFDITLAKGPESAMGEVDFQWLDGYLAELPQAIEEDLSKLESALDASAAAHQAPDVARNGATVVPTDALDALLYGSEEEEPCAVDVGAVLPKPANLRAPLQLSVGSESDDEELAQAADDQSSGDKRVARAALFTPMDGPPRKKQRVASPCEFGESRISPRGSFSMAPSSPRRTLPIVEKVEEQQRKVETVQKGGLRRSSRIASQKA